MRLSNFIFDVSKTPEPDSGNLIKYESDLGAYASNEIMIYQGMMIEQSGSVDHGNTENAQHYILAANNEITKNYITADNKLSLTGSLSGHHNDLDADIRVHTFTVINGDNKG